MGVVSILTPFGGADWSAIQADCMARVTVQALLFHEQRG
jgi:hypothetical protein